MSQFIPVFYALEQLARLVVSEEEHAVSCAAEEVSEAARVFKFERSVLADKATRIRAQRSLSSIEKTGFTQA